MSKWIQLTQNKWTEVDAEDYDMIIANGPFYFHRESYNNNRGTIEGYAQRSLPGGKKLHLARLVIGDPPKGFEIDHLDQNKLNNRRQNLRIVEHSVNMKNRTCIRMKDGKPYGKSKYKGVTYHKRNKKWYAQITVKGKNHYLGYYNNEEDAAEVYNKTAEKLFGEFSAPNKI